MRYDLLRQAVWTFVDMAAEAHRAIWRIVRGTGLRMDDKALHFWVFGMLGALLFAAVWRLFWLMRRHPGVAAFLFSLTAVALLALAVEMGQQISGTGAMELSDIAAGVGGFLVLAGALAVIATVVLGVRRLLGGGSDRRRRK